MPFCFWSEWNREPSSSSPTLPMKDAGIPRIAAAETVVAALRKRGFEAVAVKTGAEAKALVAGEAKDAASVGRGGSETPRETGIRAMLARIGLRDVVTA